MSERHEERDVRKVLILEQAEVLDRGRALSRSLEDIVS
jgi:hypothetical protein